MPNLYFLLCGHGRLDINSKKEVQYMRKENTNVITLAPPGATCSYSPEGLMELKDLSVDYLKKKKENRKDTSLATFWRRIKKYQITRLGSEYCGEWIEYYSTEYSPFKACGLQNRMIHHKVIHFDTEVAEQKRAIGIWDLQTGTNHLKKIANELTSVLFDELDFKLEDIIDTLHRKFPGNTINILDCTCSVIYDKNGDIITGQPLKRIQSTLDKQYIRVANEVLPTPKDASPFTPDSSMSVKKTKGSKETAATPEESATSKARGRAAKKEAESPPAVKSKGAKTVKGVPTASDEEVGPFTSGVKARTTRKKTPELKEDEEVGPFTSTASKTRRRGI